MCANAGVVGRFPFSMRTINHRQNPAEYITDTSHQLLHSRGCLTVNNTSKARGVQVMRGGEVLRSSAVVKLDNCEKEKSRWGRGREKGGQEVVPPTESCESLSLIHSHYTATHCVPKELSSCHYPSAGPFLHA